MTSCGTWGVTICLHYDLMTNQSQRDQRQRLPDALSYGAVVTTHARAGTDDETNDEMNDTYEDAQRVFS